MARIYKIIEKRNPHYEEMREKFKDKPEILKNNSPTLYGLAEVYFKERWDQMTDQEIVDAVDSYTENLLKDWFIDKQDLIDFLKMVLEGLESRPLVVNVDKWEDKE